MLTHNISVRGSEQITVAKRSVSDTIASYNSVPKVATFIMKYKKNTSLYIPLRFTNQSLQTSFTSMELQSDSIDS